MSKICTVCNTENLDTATYCKGCGASLEDQGPRIIWYLRRNQKNYGPYSPRVMIDLITSGQIQPGEYIWKSGTPQWITVASSELAGYLPQMPAQDPNAYAQSSQTIQPQAMQPQMAQPQMMQPQGTQQAMQPQAQPMQTTFNQEQRAEKPKKKSQKKNTTIPILIGCEILAMVIQIISYAITTFDISLFSFLSDSMWNMAFAFSLLAFMILYPIATTMFFMEANEGSTADFDGWMYYAQIVALFYPFVALLLASFFGMGTLMAGLQVLNSL